MTYNLNKPAIKKNRSILKTAFLGLLLICLVMVALELFNVTHFFHAAPASFTPAPTRGGASVNNSKGEPSSSGNGNTSVIPGSDDSPSKNNTPTAANLIAPFGEFVSNNRPNLSGTPTPNTLTSVCSSTPGATCSISFTKNGTTRSLPAQTIDSEGNTYWNNWSLREIGITLGTWKITAKAQLNGKSLITNDVQELVVSE